MEEMPHMKYFVASDIHGSFADCEMLLRAYEREGADKLLLLGDILYHGPRNDLPPTYAPKKVFALLNPCRDQILCVRGNCDAEVDQMVLDFPVLTEHRLLDLWDRRILMTHGHHINIDCPPDPALAQGAKVLLYGHTHVPLWKAKAGFLCLNPGSVSIPKNGSWKGYLLLEEAGITFKDLEGNIKHICDWEGKEFR